MALDPQRVHKPAKKLRKIIKRASSQPLPEAVHDLRTNIRKFEATITALSPLTGSTKRLQKHLSRLRKRAGKVRDMDVLTGYAAAIDAGGDQDCKVQLLEHLGAQRHTSAKKLHKAIAKNGQSVRRDLKKVANELDRLLCVRADGDCDPTPAAAQATATALTLQSELATTPAHLGRQNLHPYRLKVKELRNLLQLAENQPDKEFVDALGNLKDAIGEWHDWGELVGTAEKVLHHASNCNLIRELKTITSRKFQSALADAETMRRKYLRASASRRKGSNRVRLPAVTAFLPKAS